MDDGEAHDSDDRRKIFDKLPSSVHRYIVVSVLKLSGVYREGLDGEGG